MDGTTSVSDPPRHSARNGKILGPYIAITPNAVVGRPRFFRPFMGVITVTSIVVVVWLAVIGEWVAGQMAAGVVNSYVSSAALYVDSILEEHLQELRSSSVLSPGTVKALDALLISRPGGKPFFPFRIWKEDTIVYARDHSMIGSRHPLSSMRLKALAGEVAAEYPAANIMGQDIDTPSKDPILEMYLPIRETGTDRVIALAETYEIPPSLAVNVTAARHGIWFMGELVIVTLFVTQIGLLYHAGVTIERQRIALNERVSTLSRMLRENTSLRHAQGANIRVTRDNDDTLRRLGADIHDGPIQLVASSLLGLDALNNTLKKVKDPLGAEARDDALFARDILNNALDELRDITIGLTLPELEKLTLPDVLKTAVQRHERRTGTAVDCHIDPNLGDEPFSLKVCAYRFVQEGLNNAYKHAGGNGQEVRCKIMDDHIDLRVTDQGLGGGATVPRSGHPGQGLIGLRDRVQSLGGEFSFHLQSSGAMLRATFDLKLMTLLYGEDND